MTKTVVYGSIDSLPRAAESSHGNFKSLQGEQFGRWKVLHLGARDKRGNSMWACQCSCEKGTLALVNGYSLTSGHSNSCGCYRDEETSKRRTTHGLYLEPAKRFLYMRYHWILRRCNNPNDKNYPWYGGRGISCNFSGPEEFVHYVMGELGLRGSGDTLDRIDNNGDYEPGNLRWADRTIQARNTRSTRLICFEGEEVPIVTLAERHGIPCSTLKARLDQLGWPIEKALHTPVRQAGTQPPAVQPSQSPHHLVRIIPPRPISELSGANPC